MSDPIVVYEALKVYLMLGGKAPKVDDDFVIAWMTPGLGRQPAARQDQRSGAAASWRAICTTCCELGRSHGPTFELNGTLVTEAQAALARMNMADRAYALIKSSAYAAGLTDYYVAAQSGADAALVFETRDGTDISPDEDTRPLQLCRLPRFLLQAARRGRRQAGERALGDGRRRQAERRRIAVRAARSRIARPLQPRFHRQLGRRARQSEAALDLAGQAGLSGAGGAVVGSHLAAAAVAGIDQGRDRADARARRAGPGRQPTAATRAAADEAAKKIALQVPDPSGGLARIGIKLALKKSQVRAGEVNDGASAATANPGANIEAYFKPYHDLGRGRSGRAADRHPAAQSQRGPRKPAGGGQLSVAVRSGQREAAPASGQSARHRFAPAQAVCPHGLGSAEEFEGEEAGSTKAQMNQALANITKFCQRVVVEQISVRARLREQCADRRVRAAVRPERHAGQVLRRLSGADHRHERPSLGLAGRHAARQGAVRRYAEAIPARRRNPQRLLPGRRTDAQRPADDRPAHRLARCRHGAAGGQPGRAADVAGRQRAGLAHTGRAMADRERPISASTPSCRGANRASARKARGR